MEKKIRPRRSLRGLQRTYLYECITTWKHYVNLQDIHMSIHEEKTFPGVKCEYHRGQNGWEISPSSWPTIIPETDLHEGFKNRCLLEKHFQVPSILISCSEFVNVTNIRDHSISQWNYFDADNYSKKINTQAESEGYPGDIKQLPIRETFSSSVYLYQLFWIRKNKKHSRSINLTVKL